MKIFLCLILTLQTMGLFASNIHFYDPEGLIRMEGRFQEQEGKHKGEPYVTFLYSDDKSTPLEVFHVLKKFVSLINEKIIKAKKSGAFLERTSKQTIFYNDKKKILRKFKVGPLNPKSSLKKIEKGFDDKLPEDHLKIFTQAKKDFWGKETYKYFLQLINSSEPDEIQEDFYVYLRRLKERARHTERLINFSHAKFFIYTWGLRYPCNELAELAPQEKFATAVAIPLSDVVAEESFQQATNIPSAPVFPELPQHRLPEVNPAYTASLATTTDKIAE